MSQQQVVIGVDAHKRTHTLVAVDALGRQLDARTVSASAEGHLAALEWAARWPQRRFALEDCRHLTRRLEGDLLAAGQRLVRVPTKLMAGVRQSARQPGKSDPIDALAVARAALREPDLPTARLDGPERELRLLVDHREHLVRERSRMMSRIRWHLHEIDPTFAVRPRGLRSDRVIEALDRHLRAFEGVLVEITRELIERVGQLNARARALEGRIGVLVARIAPSLLRIPGCGVLSAAKIVGETARASRFRSRSAFARWNGTAPQPVWSGNADRFRLSRGGNRQVNAALHRIAVTQARIDSPGRSYLARRIMDGKTRTEALRLLRRRLSDVVYRTLLTDEAQARLT